MDAYKQGDRYIISMNLDEAISFAKKIGADIGASAEEMDLVFRELIEA